jgi:hypothetical protein
MAVFAINYNLAEVARTTMIFHEAIGTLGNHGHILESMWMVSTTSTALEIRDEQKQHVDWNDELRLLQFYLGDRLRSPAAAFSIETLEREEDEGEFLFGYLMSKKLFPYDDELTVTEFNDAVQAVVRIGYEGVRYLSEALIFDLSEEDSDIMIGDKISYHKFVCSVPYIV